MRPLSKSGVSRELRYLGSPSPMTRPPKAIGRERRSMIGNMTRPRKKSNASRPSSGRTSSPASSSRLSEMPCAFSAVRSADAAVRRVAQPEFADGRVIETAALEIGHADAARRRPELCFIPGTGRLDDIRQRFLLFGARDPSASGAASRARRGRRAARPRRGTADCRCAWRSR